MESKKQENAELNYEKNILWRISSTFFSHLRSDVDLSPLEDLSRLIKINNLKYKKMTSYDKLTEELKAINLHKTKHKDYIKDMIN